MPTKLSQVIALEAGAKPRTVRTVTDIYHQLQKPNLFAGLSRTYKPRDDEGEQLPGESTQVQQRVDELYAKVAEALTRSYDLAATKDATNATATADVVIDGQVILRGLHAVTLLYLEKQLADLRALVATTPTLDPAEKWEWSNTAGAWTTSPTQTTRTKKVPRNHVLAEATNHHPAQVQVYNEDVIAGDWSTIKMSGACPVQQVNGILHRIDTLRDAVKVAREEANGAPALDVHIGQNVFAYILAPTTP